MLRSKAIVLVALVGCSRSTQDPPPSPEGDEPAPEPTLAPLASADMRPPVGLLPVGEDITELVKRLNAKGKEPQVPTRKGVVTGTPLRPRITKTDKGFEAAIPSSSRVSAPAIAGGTLLAGGHGGREMYGMDPETGKTVWALNLSDDGPTEPSCEGEICVFNTYSCTTFAVEASTGKHLWSWYLGSPQLATTVISGGLVYASYPDYAGPDGFKFVLGAHDLKTGAPKWRRWIDAEVNSAPVAHAGHIYLATKVGTLFQFGAKDGEVVSVLKNRIASPPVLTEGGVLFGGEELELDNDLVAAQRPLFPALEVPAKRRLEPVVPRPRPLVAHHRLIAVEKNGALVARHHKTGRKLWSAQGLGEPAPNVAEPLSYAGKSILMAMGGGTVVRLEPDTGKVMDTYRMGDGNLSSQPIAVGGWIYSGMQGGKLAALDTGEPEITGWPMMGATPDRAGKVGE